MWLFVSLCRVSFFTPSDQNKRFKDKSKSKTTTPRNRDSETLVQKLFDLIFCLIVAWHFVWSNHSNQTHREKKTISLLQNTIETLTVEENCQPTLNETMWWMY